MASCDWIRSAASDEKSFLGRLGSSEKLIPANRQLKVVSVGAVVEEEISCIIHN